MTKNIGQSNSSTWMDENSLGIKDSSVLGNKAENYLSELANIEDLPDEDDDLADEDEDLPESYDELDGSVIEDEDLAVEKDVDADLTEDDDLILDEDEEEEEDL